MGDSTVNLNQDVLLFLHRPGISVLHLLETRIATMMATMLATTVALLSTAAAVAVTLIVFALTTQPLDPEPGSQCTHHFALQKDVASRVSC